MSQLALFGVTTTGAAGSFDNVKITKVNGQYASTPTPNDSATRAGESRTEIASGQFDKNKPTIVLTHGWQPGQAWSGPSTAFPMEALLGATKQKLNCEKLGEICDANIITVKWQGAYHLLNTEPAWQAWSAGAQMSKELVGILKNDYTQNIHLVGHSYGSLVNVKDIRQRTRLCLT